MFACLMLHISLKREGEKKGEREEYEKKREEKGNWKKTEK